MSTSTPSRFAAMALSVVWPGVGHVYWGRPRLGWTLALCPSAGFLLGAVAFLVGLPTSVVIGLFVTGPLGTWQAVSIGHLLFARAPEPMPFEQRPGAGAILAPMATGFLMSVAAVVLVRTQVIEPFRIPAAGMAPTIIPGDHLLVRKGVFADPIERGTIVVFRYPKNERLIYVQRVVGLPGDRIAFVDDRLVVEGLDVAYRPVGAAEVRDDECSVIRIGVHEEVAAGRAWTVGFDTPGFLATTREVRVPEGYVFVVGDNRDHSEDSRRWGFLPIDNVVGTADRIWFSVDPCGAGGLRSERAGLFLQPSGG